MSAPVESVATLSNEQLTAKVVALELQVAQLTSQLAEVSSRANKKGSKSTPPKLGLSMLDNAGSSAVPGINAGGKPKTGNVAPNVKQYFAANYAKYKDQVPQSAIVKANATFKVNPKDSIEEQTKKFANKLWDTLSSIKNGISPDANQEAKDTWDSTMRLYTLVKSASDANAASIKSAAAASNANAAPTTSAADLVENAPLTPEADEPQP